MDRIGICEVYSVLAHDFGLYGIATRLDRMGFRPGLSLAIGKDRGLDEEQFSAYEALSERAERTDPYSVRLAR